MAQERYDLRDDYMKRDIEITDGIGEKHVLNLDVYHTSSGGNLGVTMIFDHGEGGHYVLRERQIKELIHTIIEVM